MEGFFQGCLFVLTALIYNKGCFKKHFLNNIFYFLKFIFNNNLSKQFKNIKLNIL